VSGIIEVVDTANLPSVRGLLEYQHGSRKQEQAARKATCFTFLSRFARSKLRFVIALSLWESRRMVFSIARWESQVPRLGEAGYATFTATSFMSFYQTDRFSCLQRIPTMRRLPYLEKHSEPVHSSTTARTLTTQQESRSSKAHERAYAVCSARKPNV